jgi:hypothetical protein
MKYTYETKIFTQENEVSYYLLGVFLTDGCMKKDRVCLSSKDKEWLEDIKNLICPSLPIVKDGKNCYRIAIYNKEIRQWLTNNKCIPNKSLILEFPNIPEQYLPDFIRGCIDGDGSISHKQYKRYRNKNGKPYLFYSTHYTLTSASKAFINEFDKILQSKNIDHSIITSKPGTKKSIIDGRQILHKNTLYQITGGHRSAFHFLNWIYYPDHQISLKRKRDLANEIIFHYQPKIL